ncbi:alcohol acetyltransferase-domain-containing protein [Mucor lusitanicus]
MTTVTISTRKSRPLGLLEKYQLSKQLTKAYGNITLTAELEHPALYHDTMSPNDQETLYQHSFAPALTRLLQAHPHLSLTVRDKTESTAHFVQLDTINLADNVQLTNITSLQDLIAEQTGAEFDVDTLLPLWRIKIMPQTATRCIVVLAELNAKQEAVGKEEDLVIHIKEATVPLPYEASGAPSLSLAWDVVPVLCHSLIPKLLPTAIARYVDPVSYDGWKGDFAAIDGEAHNTDVRLITVPCDMWKPIMNECKRQGISVHAIVFMALMLAWTRLYPDQTTEASTPINCRGLCNPPVPNNQIGNFVGAYTSMWTGKQLQQDAWLLAKKYHNDLNKSKVDGAKQPLFLKYLPEFPASYCDFWYDKRKNSAMGRAGGIELSDLGRFACPPQQDTAWRVKQMFFCQSAQTFTNAFHLNSVTTNDTLFCTLSWQKGSLDAAKINKFHDTFIGILKNLPLKELN